MKYLLILGAALLFGGVAALAHFVFPKKEKIIVERVLIALAIGLFFVRFMCYDDIQVYGGWRSFMHVGGPQGTFLSLMGELCIWLIIPANILLFMRAFSKEKTASWFVKFISLPIILISIICLYPMTINMIGVNNTAFSDMKLVEIMLPIELGATLALSVYYFVKDWKVRIGKPEYVYVGVVSSVGSIFAIPPFLPMFLFGEGRDGMFPYDLSQTHRYVIYILFITRFCSSGDDSKFLKEGLNVDLSFYNGELLGVMLPDKVELKVVHTEPAVKGNTTNNATKDAELETGLVIRVPLFVEENEMVIVSTSTGKYDSRA